jgi:hypothetical protein
MFTKFEGYLVILRYGDGPGAAENVVTHNYILCKTRAALDAALTKGGLVIKIVEFSEDTVDSCFLGD